MKKSIISDIFNGIRGNVNTMRSMKDNRELSVNICKTYDKLAEKLTPEQINLLERHTDALEDNLCHEVDYFFSEGFKLGLLVGIECMEE